MNVTGNDTTTSDSLMRGVAENAIIVIVLLVIFIMAVVGNIAVIVAVMNTPSLREELSNIFIINLSATDLASAVVVMLSALVAIGADRWPFGQAWCDVVCLANYCFIIVAMLTLSFISIDRYIAVVRPLHYNFLMTKSRVLLMIVYSWIQGLTFSVIPVVFRWIGYDYWEGICAIRWYQQRHTAFSYVISAVVICFSIPGFILVVCYIKVLQTAYRQRQIVPAVVKVQGQREQTTSSNLKAIYGLLVVVFMFFVSMTPFSITKLYKVSVNDETILQDYVSLVASIVAYLSGALNPLVYGIFRKDFRNAFKSIFRKFLFRRF